MNFRGVLERAKESRERGRTIASLTFRIGSLLMLAYFSLLLRTVVLSRGFSLLAER